MQHEQRRSHLADALVGAELVLHQETHREDRIDRGRDIDGRGKGRFQNNGVGFFPGRKLNRHTGAKRLSPDHQPR